MLFIRRRRLSRNLLRAYANLGAALLEGNNPSPALDYLQRAVELDPKLGLAHYNLGLVKEQLRDWVGAIASYKKAMEYSPNAPEPAYHLGRDWYWYR